MLGSLKAVGRDGRPRNATALEGDANADALSGVELVSESESWLLGSGGAGRRRVGDRLHGRQSPWVLK